jgi:hypothetical protein
MNVSIDERCVLGLIRKPGWLRTLKELASSAPEWGEVVIVMKKGEPVMVQTRKDTKISEA